MRKISSSESKNEVLNLHSGAIQVENKLSLKARLCWFSMVYKAMPDMKNQDIFTMTIGDLKKSIDYRNTNNKDFKSILEELRDTKIEWNIFEKNEPSWGWDHLLSGCRVRLNSNVIEYSFSPFLREKLVNPEMYAKINLLISKNFKSKHSLAIYCLALDYLFIKENYGEKTISLEDMRKFLGLEDSEYIKPSDLNFWVIQKAVLDINKDSDMNLSVEIKRGERNKIVAFKLKMSIKNEYLESYKKQKLPKLISTNKQISIFEEIKEEEIKIETEAVKPKRELIKIDSKESKEFFAEYKISISTNTVQNKLKELKEMFNHRFENYLIFLMNYTKSELKLKNIKNVSGFYVGLLKDDSQLDNYIIYLQNIEKTEEKRRSRIKSLVEVEIKNKYDDYLSNDFDTWIIKNVDKIESKIIAVLTKTISKDHYLYNLVIYRHNNGVIDKTLITESKDGTKRAIITHLKNYKEELDYKPLSFDDWKNENIKPEDIKKLEEQLLNK